MPIIQVSEEQLEYLRVADMLADCHAEAEMLNRISNRADTDLYRSIDFNLHTMKMAALRAMRQAIRRTRAREGK